MIKSYTYKKNNYKSLIKVILPSLLFLVMLFSLFSLSNNKIIINNLSKVFYGDNEVELDNWEISTVFYDSTVDDGKTPLTEINWDASDGGYGEGEKRTITVQINYKNSNTVTDYEPGKIKIYIPNMVHKYGDMKINATIMASANDINHSGYDWDFVYQGVGYNNAIIKYPSTEYENFIFSNASIIEKSSNLEGSIQIKYTITPVEMRDGSIYPIPKHDNTTTVEYNTTFNSELGTKENNIKSNNLTYNYKRIYSHPWKRNNIPYDETTSKLHGYDGLPKDAKKYIWVKYNYKCNGAGSSSSTAYYSSYPYIAMSTYTAIVQTEFPDDVIVYGAKTKKRLYPDETTGKYNIYYEETDNNTYSIRSVLVGYPIDKYNKDNNNLLINNESKYYGYWYDNIDKLELINEDSVEINLENYFINIPQNLYSITKEKYGQPLKYLAIKRKYTDSKDNEASFIIKTQNIYDGKKMKIEIGDDLLYASESNGSYKKLSDNDYYFENVSPCSLVQNINNEIIEKNKYNADVYVRYKGEESYVKYKSITVPISTTIDFSKESKKVVGVYFVVYDVEESFISSSYYNVKFTKEDIPENGNIYNFGYNKVYINNENENYVLQNKGNIEDYSNFPNSSEIATNDINNNGYYLQRAFAYQEWKNQPIERANTTLVIDKTSSYKQNEEKKIFSGTYKIGVEPQTTAKLDMHYINDYSNKYYFHGFTAYDLLPLGININSTEKEIEESIEHNFIWESQCKIAFFNERRERIDKEDAFDIIKKHITVTIKKNYKGTGRDYIKIDCDLSEEPLMIFTENTISSLRLYWYINYNLSYDDFLEYGNKYTNYLYVNKKDMDEYVGYSNNYSNISSISDKGILDKQAIDINENGNTEEVLGYTKNNMLISSVISTYQDVQTTVQSDKSNFDTGKVDTSVNSTYTYKLRARTGTNDVTNLVIYDSLENYAKDPNMKFIDSAKGYHKWKGEFLDIDTSYAESKGYNIRTYYSESDQPGSIKDDDSWVLYTDSVDKTKVKSLAFEYLDNEGNPAVLPANSLTYVLVKMKSPSDENIKTFAYNGCWTEWNAIDSITGEAVDFITGINSNIVKVALPNSVEPQDIDLEINKYWNDSNNKLGIRPNTTTIQVVPDEDLTKAIDIPLGITNVDSNNSNHWKTTISVPKYDLDGNTINYTFRENEIVLDNNYKYTPEVNDNSITNTLNKEIELKKIWKDNTNSYLTRPSNVTYKIKQNNTLYDEVTFTGDYSTNEWTKTITVPVYDENGREYNYSLEEVSVENYTSSCENYTCTNTLSGNDTLNINKTWVDKNNQYNTRPNSIMVNILQNNNTYRGVTLNNSNNWRNTVTVPKYDSNGVKYNYTLEEEAVDEYGLVEYNQNTYNITNTLKANTILTVTKHWVDDNNSSNTRPSELKITLLQNNNEYRELTLTGNTNTWTTTIEVPKYDNNQNKYTYSIREKTDNLNSDYSDITYSEEELSVTNTLNKKQDLIIKKKWIDQDNEYLTRPSKVSINVLRDGEVFRTIELSGDSNIWTHTINDIDIYDSNGKKYNYTIKEDTVLEKYNNIMYDQTNLEVTNELTEIPTVTLYFTVVNGYIDPVTGEMKYDDFGLNEIMKHYNVNPNDEYIFKFELKNTETGKIYEGKLSTKGILEFDDLPYGEYKAIEGEDKLFKFVDMLEIEEVNGVKFEKRGKEGFITITPTGENIIHGIKIINKIEAPIVNPKTSVKGLFLLLTILIITIISFIFIKKKKELYH